MSRQYVKVYTLQGATRTVPDEVEVVTSLVDFYGVSVMEHTFEAYACYFARGGNVVARLRVRHRFDDYPVFFSKEVLAISREGYPTVYSVLFRREADA